MVQEVKAWGWTCLVLGLAKVSFLTACGGSPTMPPPPQVAVSIHPQGASVVAGSQSQQFSANVTGDPKNLGVTWSVDGIGGGNSAVGTITSSGVYTPPGTAGSHQITATSIADTLKSASAPMGVTDLPGISTYHYDLARDGVNSHEFALTTAGVRQNTFGKLFSCPVDGAVYTETLWMPSLTVNGAVHNVIFVATQHDSLYAFDADASPCQQLWHVNLIDSVHGGKVGETPVWWQDVGSCFADIQPEIGVTGTPVIDPVTKTLFVVSKSEIQNAIPGCPPSLGNIFFQRLHAIDLSTGNEKFNAPVNIAATVPGAGDGSSGGVLNFNPQSHGQRAGLMLSNGTVYIAWASHEDAFPYHGWILGYNASNVQQQVAVYNTTPNGGLGGIWMGGGAPAVDASGNIYFSTGNGTFDADQAASPNNDFGDSVLKLGAASGLAELDFFTPYNQFSLNSSDLDLGSGGVVLLPDQTGSFPHLLVTGGKEGMIYLIDRDNMGQFRASGNSQIVQSFFGDNGSFTTPVFWQNNLYIAGAYQGNQDSLRMYNFNPVTWFSTTPSSSSGHVFPFPGATPVISASGASNGIVWAVDTSCYGVPSPSPCGNTMLPATLFAFDASNLASLWDSSQSGARDQAGNAVKFTVPTVANGKVYIGTRTEIDVYGLLP